jgi:hypothetical protein
VVEFHVFLPLDTKNEPYSGNLFPLYACSCFGKETNLLKVGHQGHIRPKFGTQVGEKPRKN